MPLSSSSLCGEIRSQVDVNFAVAAVAWTFPCRKFNFTMKPCVCVCALKKTCEPRTTFACVQARRQLCKRVGNSIALLWLVDVAARAHEKIKGNTARRRLRRQGAPPLGMRGAVTKAQPKPFCTNSTPDCGHLEASAKQRSDSVGDSNSDRAETTSQPLCALLDHSQSAVARVRYKAKSHSHTQPVAQYDSITAAKANLRVQRQ